MSHFTDTFARVNELKDQPWEPPAEIVTMLSKRYREATGQEISSAELQTMVQGLGWTIRMAHDAGIDPDEMAATTELLLATTRRNVARIGVGGLDDLAVGLGAGFFTGLYVGLLL